MSPLEKILSDFGVQSEDLYGEMYLEKIIETAKEILALIPKDMKLTYYDKALADVRMAMEGNDEKA